ncbi:hypothetical protein [Priestia koreensis]|uniref:hypothetical protein n=1 Tax=Priestia koreensis TaxID=284581 RepID=UPI00345A5C30
MIDKIKDSYLALNLYSHSDLLHGIVRTFSFDEKELKEKNINDLKAVHYLLICEKMNYSKLIKDILFNLARTMERESVVSRGSIRGSIDWGTTFKQRAASGFSDLSLFVSKPNIKNYDVKANQLFKFILYKVASLIKKNNNSLPSRVYFNELNAEIDSILLHPRMREITSPKNLTFDLIHSVKRHKNKQYRLLYELGLLYYKLFVKNDTRTLFEVIKNQTLLPKDEDKIYEYVVFFELINALEKKRTDIGGSRKITLLKALSRTTFKFKFNDGSLIRVHYQHTPQKFSSKSRYKETLLEYGYNGQTSIPDIVLEYVKKNTIEPLLSYKSSIIEVKYSTSRAYTGIGLQAVQSYLEEYRDILISNPKALLVVWDDPIKRPNMEMEKEIVMTGFNSLQVTIEKMLQKIMT